MTHSTEDVVKALDDAYEACRECYGDADEAGERLHILRELRDALAKGAVPHPFRYCDDCDGLKCQLRSCLQEGCTRIREGRATATHEGLARARKLNEVLGFTYATKDSPEQKDG